MMTTKTTMMMIVMMNCIYTSLLFVLSCFRPLEIHIHRQAQTILRKGKKFRASLLYPVCTGNRPVTFLLLPLQQCGTAAPLVAALAPMPRSL